MSSESFKKIEDLYHTALELPPEDREAFLETGCGGDADVRKEVEDLLANNDDTSNLLDSSPGTLAAEVLEANELSANHLSGKVERYEILDILGKGGMGTVYLARDESLDRLVAFKVLKEHLINNKDRVQRFRQEARAASALNHPNILTVFEFGEVEGLVYIVTEYIDGEPLRNSLRQQTPNLNWILDVAIQIVSALEAAHSSGIIHRDIKPDNIMVRPDGLIKVLDFGIAKLTEESLPEDVTSDIPETGPGMIMGTANYMSPEQAKSEGSDVRSDIFSFGIVLHEMISGRLPFQGESAMEMIASIIHKTPDSLSGSNLPPEVEKIVSKCLRKDPDERFQTSQELANELRKVKQELEFQNKLERTFKVDPVRDTDVRLAGTDERLGRRDTSQNEVDGNRSAGIAPFTLGVLGLMLVSGIGLSAWYFPHLFGFGPSVTSQNGIANAEYKQLTSFQGEELFPSISPDGKSIVYSRTVDDNEDIFLRRVGGENEINLTKDSKDADAQPAFSPDGEQIAFRSDRNGGGIFIMGATGEAARQVAEGGFYPSWSPDSKELVYSASDFSDPTFRDPVPNSLWIVNISSGEKRELTKGDAIQPHWSPNGKRIAYWGIDKSGQKNIATISVDGGTPTPVTKNKFIDWNPIWSADGEQLYFASNRGGSMNLWRVGIDPITGVTTGSPEAITTPSTYSQHLSLSKSGKELVYVQNRSNVNILEYSFDSAKERFGTNPTTITEGANKYQNPDVSPDGQWIAFDGIRNNQRDLYVSRIDGSDLRQVTNDKEDERGARWSRDGKRLISYSSRDDGSQGWIMNPDGSGLRRFSDGLKGDVRVVLWSPDGKQILTNVAGHFPVLLDPDKSFSEQTPVPLLENPPKGYDLMATSWSPVTNRIIADRFNDDPLVQGIVTYDVDSGEYEELTDFGASPYWLKDGVRALFLDERNIYILNTETKKTKKIFSAAPDFVQNITIGPNDDSVFVAIEKNEADIWLARMK